MAVLEGPTRWAPQVGWSRLQLLSARAVALSTMSIAAVTTLVTLGRQPLSWDEAVTLDAAERSPALLWRMLGHTDAPLGLYYALIHGWLVVGRPFGWASAAWWLRLPSALAAIGAVGLLTVLATRWFGSTAGLVGGALLAVHPMLTFYAQDARPYALVTVTFLAATLALSRAIRTPSWPRLALYGLAVTGCLYLHLFSGYALAAHLLPVVRTTRGRPRLRMRWVTVYAAVVAAVAPLVLVARRQTAEVAWIAKPTPGIVLAVLSRMAGGGWLGLLLLAIIATGVGRQWLRRGVRSEPRVSFLVAWLAVPLLALVAVDLVVPDLVARYALVCVPAAAALVGWAVVRHGRAGAGLAAAAMVVAAVTSGQQLSRPFKYEDYRAAADQVGDLARPGDAVMFFPRSMRVGFDAYRTLEPDLAHVRDAALAPGGGPTQTDQISGLDLPAAELAARFRSATRIFVLGTPLTALSRTSLSRIDEAQLAVLTDYRVVHTARWGVVTVTELERLPAVPQPSVRPHRPAV